MCVKSSQSMNKIVYLLILQKHLLKMHDMRAGFIRRRARLRYRAKLLLEMDKAIMREGGVHNLPSDALRNACFIRGRYLQYFYRFK